MKLSVLIPTCNEEAEIGKTLQRLGDIPAIDEVILGDGGSEDDTVVIAAETGVCSQILESLPRKRAAQLNACARAASGDVLIFLHADTWISAPSIENVKRAMARSPELLGGGFSRRFRCSSLVLRLTCLLASFRGRYGGIFYGDQGIFVRRITFAEMGGFDEQIPLAEDLEFSLRLRGLGKTKLIGPPVQSSPRRFDQNGALRQSLADAALAKKLRREFSNSSRK